MRVCDAPVKKLPVTAVAGLGPGAQDRAAFLSPCVHAGHLRSSREAMAFGGSRHSLRTVLAERLPGSLQAQGGPRPC